MRRLLLYVIGLYGLALCSMLSPACALHQTGSPDDQVRTALDVLADVINPASALASEACHAQKEAITSAVEAHTLAAPTGAAQLEVAIAHCKQLEFSFNEIRNLHGEASSFIESGQLVLAQQKLADLRNTWKNLEGAPVPPLIPVASDGGGS